MTTPTSCLLSFGNDGRRGFGLSRRLGESQVQASRPYAERLVASARGGDQHAVDIFIFKQRMKVRNRAAAPFKSRGGDQHAADIFIFKQRIKVRNMVAA